MFSGWGEVCGSQARVEGGIQSLGIQGGLSPWCRVQQDDSRREEAVPEPAGPGTEDPVVWCSVVCCGV